MREADRYKSKEAEVVEEQSYKRVTVTLSQIAHGNKHAKGKVQSKEIRGANDKKVVVLGHQVPGIVASKQEKECTNRHGGKHVRHTQAAVAKPESRTYSSRRGAGAPHASIFPGLDSCWPSTKARHTDRSLCKYVLNIYHVKSSENNGWIHKISIIIYKEVAQLTTHKMPSRTHSTPTI